MDALTLGELADVLGADRKAFPAEATFRNVSIDSRTTKPGDVFWAIAGERFDGHDYIPDAIKAGAAAVVVSRDAQDTIPKLQVPDVRAALSGFSAWYRSMLLGTVVGITGSVGKTTTRRMIADILSSRYLTTQSPKNFNNDLGVPLSLLAASAEDHFIVLELGASGIGEIQSLSSLCSPEIGVVTAIAPAHLEGFGSIEGVCQAKGELVEALPEFGVALLNGDDSNVRQLAARADCMVKFFGTNSDCDIQATEVLACPDELRFTVDGFDYALSVVGRHHLTSALAAVAVGREAGLLPNEIQDGFNVYEPTTGRCHIQRIGEAIVIDDTYNASPQSVLAAAQALGQFREQARRIMVLGDMGELGDDAKQLHFTTGETCGEQGDIDLFLTIGLFAAEWAAGIASAGGETVAVSTEDELSELLKQQCQSGDAVLLKGSRSSAMERFLKPLCDHLKSLTSESNSVT